MRIPAAIMMGLGAVQVVAGLTVAIYGSQANNFVLFLIGTVSCGPGALVLGAGLALRRLRGWNLVFSGLLSTIAVAAGIAGLLTFYEAPGAYLFGGPILVGLGLLVWHARLEEDSEIRAARSLIYPPKAREAVDFQRW